MNDETEIEAVDAAEIDQAEMVAAERAPKKRFGPIALVGTAFLASLLGAGAMYGASTFIAPNTPNLGPLEDKLKTVTSASDTAVAETKALTVKITRLERELKARPAASPPVDLTAIERRLAALEDVVPSLEAPQIDEDVLARLEALQGEGSSTLDLSEILSRLAALESNASSETDILKRLDELESRPQAVVTAPSTVAMSSAPREIMPFPEDKIRQAIDRASPEKGWLNRTLKKHISVQSEDNPRYLLETILEKIEAGDIEAAIAAFDKLPPQIKSAGQNWRDTMESSK